MDAQFNHYQQPSFSTVWAYKLWNGPGRGWVKLCTALSITLHRDLPLSHPPKTWAPRVHVLNAGRDSGLPIYILPPSSFPPFFLANRTPPPPCAQLQNHFPASHEAKRLGRHKRVSSGRISRKATYNAARRCPIFVFVLPSSCCLENVPWLCHNLELTWEWKAWVREGKHTEGRTLGYWWLWDHYAVLAYLPMDFFTWVKKKASILFKPQ